MGKAAVATFGGFVSGTTTPVPDELFDLLLATLSGAELKVVLYITRRTLGFQKRQDAISLSQICGGIVTREGRRLDWGTGLSRSTAQVALKELCARGIIRAHRRASAAGGNAATAYSLNFGGAWAENRSVPGSKTDHRADRKPIVQETVEQQASIGSALVHPAKPGTPAAGDLAAVWAQVKHALRGELSAANYRTFVERVTLLEVREAGTRGAAGAVATFGVPSAAMLPFWQAQHRSRLEHALAAALGRPVAVAFHILSEIQARSA